MKSLTNQQNAQGTPSKPQQVASSTGSDDHDGEQYLLMIWIDGYCGPPPERESLDREEEQQRKGCGKSN